jgi:hypothetical protein
MQQQQQQPHRQPCYTHLRQPHRGGRPRHAPPQLKDEQRLQRNVEHIGEQGADEGGARVAQAPAGQGGVGGDAAW